MAKKIKNFFQGELFTAIFYLLFGLCFLIFPIQTTHILSRGVFSLLLAGTGAYQLYLYIKTDEDATVLNMFTGVIILVMAGFLFASPKVVEKLLPMFLGAVVMVDSIPAFRMVFQIRKKGEENWQLFLGAALFCLVMGLIVFFNPFGSTRVLVIFAGVVLLLSGGKDLILFLYRGGHIKRRPKIEDTLASVSSNSRAEEYQEYDPELAQKLAAKDSQAQTDVELVDEEKEAADSHTNPLVLPASGELEKKEHPALPGETAEPQPGETEAPRPEAIPEKTSVPAEGASEVMQEQKASVMAEDPSEVPQDEESLADYVARLTEEET